MIFLRKIWALAKDFFSRYPAVLSGYVIYAYLFVSIMHYYIKVKTIPLNFYEIFTIFSALPFMWFLSVALVKIIDIKTKLYESERQRILAQKELELQNAQMEAMKETVRGLQHYINNPLTVVMLSMEAASKAASENQEVVYSLKQAKQSIDRIQQALSGFTSMESYKTEPIDTYYGKMVTLKPTAQIH